ncbi:zinc finger MYM-type protein 1-like [Macrobrachium rosenbergii]|uniref:zinc finger MYM-type protein 1-like n=1 Tax=Macrobrachium rosenbergii TaxID=79674 RepID=UPI0034D47F76
MLDSTPDAAHREQMSEIIRYVEINYKGCSKYTVNLVMQQLEKDHLPFEDCRSQCYDNAAVMSGHKSGVQQRLVTVNPKTIYVNCNNHSLNLAGVRSASHEVVMVTFFGTVQAVYVFFSRSIYRWERLKKNLPISVKAESETRWSARADAVRPIHENVGDLVQLLETIGSHLNKTDTRSEATQLLSRILTFDFFAVQSFWNILLTKIDRVQKRLQDPKLNFHEAAQDIQALQVYFFANREGI